MTVRLQHDMAIGFATRKASASRPPDPYPRTLQPIGLQKARTYTRYNRIRKQKEKYYA